MPKLQATFAEEVPDAKLAPFLKPFPAAIAFFSKKLPIPTENWKTISEEYQAIAFTVASITRLSLLADIKKIIEKQLESGISPEAFREQFRDAVIRAGWDPKFSPYRVNLILSQNIRNSYQFGRWQQSEEPAFKQRHPYRVWRHRDSVVPRPHHLAQDGKVYTSDSEIWKAIAPPPFGCKCSFYNLSQRQLEKEGLSVSNPPKLSAIAEPGFSKGYPKNLSEQRQQLIDRAIASLPSNLSALLEEDVELSEPVDFATKKPKNARTCRKGFPCGNSCISRSKMCRKRLEGQYATAAQWLESKLPPLPSKKSHLHTEFIEQGYSAIGKARMAEIDSLLKGDPIEKERLEKEYMAAQKELMAALDNNKMRVKDREAVRAKHKAAEDAYFNYEKYNRRQAAQKMEDFRLQLVSEGLSRTEAKKILETIDFDTNSLNSINKSLKGDFTRTDLDEAIIDFQQLTNGKSGTSLKSVKNSYFADGRAYATRTGELSIGSSPDKRVIFHELGHHLEFESETTLQAAKSWIESRKTGGPKKLNELTNSPYDDDEIAYPDKFIKPYVGKIYPDATEVISMGIEHFTSGRMMLELYQNDKDHFALTVGIIKS